MVKKNQELEPLRLFIPYYEVISVKLHNIAIKVDFTTVFTKWRDLWRKFRFNHKEPKDASGVVDGVNCNDYNKVETGKTGCKLREKIKEHRSDGGKRKKKEKNTGLSQHVRQVGHKIAW